MGAAAVPRASLLQLPCAQTGTETTTCRKKCGKRRTCAAPPLSALLFSPPTSPGLPVCVCVYEPIIFLLFWTVLSPRASRHAMHMNTTASLTHACTVPISLCALSECHLAHARSPHEFPFSRVRGGVEVHACLTVFLLNWNTKTRKTRGTRRTRGPAPRSFPDAP